MQVFELQHDLAAVLAADRGDQLLEELRSVAECIFDRCKARAFEMRMAAGYARRRMVKK